MISHLWDLRKGQVNIIKPINTSLVTLRTMVVPIRVYNIAKGLYSPNTCTLNKEFVLKAQQVYSVNREIMDHVLCILCIEACVPTYTTSPLAKFPRLVPCSHLSELASCTHPRDLQHVKSWVADAHTHTPTPTPTSKGSSLVYQTTPSPALDGIGNAIHPELGREWSGTGRL